MPACLPAYRRVAAPLPRWCFLQNPREDPGLLYPATASAIGGLECWRIALLGVLLFETAVRDAVELPSYESKITAMGDSNGYARWDAKA